MAEDPGALRATIFPGNVDGVRALLLGRGGQADVIESTRPDPPVDGSSPRPKTAGETIRVRRWAPLDDTWSVTESLEGVTAFALGPHGTFVASAGGRVLMLQADGGAPPQVLAPPVAADLVAFGGNASHVLAHASAPDGGTPHVWSRTVGTHWSARVEGTLSAMAVTNDGSTVLAVVSHGEASRAGRAIRLLRWRMADAADPTIVEMGHLAPPSSVCEALRTANVGSDIGVVATDLTDCGDIAPSNRLRITTADRQATIFTSAGVAIARIDHAAKVLKAGLSMNRQSAVTLDESGHLQLFAVEAKDLIAQACSRHPAGLSDELRAILPRPESTVDACGGALQSDRPR